MEKEKNKENKEKDKNKNKDINININQKEDNNIEEIVSCDLESKRKIDLERLGHAFVNLLIYFAVLFIKDDDSTYLVLIKIIPILITLNSFIYGLRIKGCDSTYSFLSGIAFIPFVYLKLGEPGWMFLLMYLGLIMVSNVTGSFIGGLFKKEDEPIGCNCKGIF